MYFCQKDIQSERHPVSSRWVFMINAWYVPLFDQFVPGVDLQWLVRSRCVVTFVEPEYLSRMLVWMRISTSGTARLILKSSRWRRSDRESSLLTSYWSQSTLSSRWFGGPWKFELPCKVLLYLHSYQSEVKMQTNQHERHREADTQVLQMSAVRKTCHFIPPRMYDEWSVCPSIRPICTRCCFTMTSKIQVCSNFRWVCVFITNQHERYREADSQVLQMTAVSPQFKKN